LDAQRWTRDAADVHECFLYEEPESFIDLYKVVAIDLDLPMPTMLPVVRLHGSTFAHRELRFDLCQLGQDCPNELSIGFEDSGQSKSPQAAGRL
jgi:hypothetical protein